MERVDLADGRRGNLEEQLQRYTSDRFCGCYHQVSD